MKHIIALSVLVLLIVSSAVAQDEPELPTMTAIQRLLAAGDADTALSYLDQRINADINDVQARFLKGLVLMGRGDNANARETFADIARLFPKLPEAFNNLAALYAQDGEYEKARRALSSAIANAPQYPKVHVNLGDLYIKMATNAYQQALELDPDDTVSAAKLDFLKQLFSATPGG